MTLNIATDGPIDIALPGCGRTVHAEATGPLPGLPVGGLGATGSRMGPERWG